MHENVEDYYQQIKSGITVTLKEMRTAMDTGRAII